MLTDKEVKNAQPREKAYKISDGGGLYFYTASTGLKSWGMKFRLHGKEKLLTFGPYPEVKLTEARTKRDEARRRLREHVDPSGARQRAHEGKARQKPEDSKLLPFDTAARSCWALQEPRWAPVHASDAIASLERDVFLSLGNFRLVEIYAPTIMKTLRTVEARGSIKAAKRLRQRISAVYV